MECLDESTILALLRAELDGDTLAAVEIHLDTCAECREVVSSMAKLDRTASPEATGFGERAPASAPSREELEVTSAWSTGDEPALLRRGESVGRYLVLRHIGAGGMGVVYAAHDPELNRTVALKLLRTGGRLQGTTGAAWLMREAQALARLAHPNVVAVHDVGMFRDQVFLAMEFIDGVTLGEWLEEKRAWREILDVFIAAGRGVEAAHQAGLVHRDFKPGNILVDKSGRVRVLDFGLARSVEATHADPALDPPGARLPNQTRLSKSGAVVGTPAYMAPEQHCGAPADPRTDQFSFCLALFEALYGVRPFQGETEEELRVAKDQGLLTIPRATGVPTWLARIVARGLASDRNDRFESMGELLAALSADRRAKRRRLYVAALLASVLVATLLVSQSGESMTCKGAEAKIASVWNEARRSEARSAFLATGLPYAALAWRRSGEVLDRYARRWVALRSDACEATRVRGEQSEAALDLRMQCFRDRLQNFAALMQVLAHADKEVVRRSVRAAHDLDDPAICGDLTALRNELRPPRGPELRRRVAGLRPRLAEVRALLRTGRYAEGLERIRWIAGEASSLDYRPLRAEAYLLRGLLEDKTGDAVSAEKSLLEAVFAAQASHHDRVLARAAKELLPLRCYRLDKIAAAREWAPHARAAAERVGRETPAWADLLHALGQLHYIGAEYAAAAAKLREAVRLRTRLLGEEHPLVASSHNDLGLVLWKMARYDEASVHLHRALALRRKVLGAQHPDVAVSLNNLGLLAWSRGRYDEAIRLHRGSLAIRIRALGATHVDVALALGNLALALRARGRVDEALNAQKRALRIREQALGADSLDVAFSAHNIGVLLAGVGRYREAVTYLERARKIRTQRMPSDHPYLARTLRGLGRALVGLGRHREAEAALRKALRISRARLGDKHPFTAMVQNTLGLACAARGAWRRALHRHRQALEIAGRSSGRRDEIGAEALLGIAEALRALGRAREAVPHAERALMIARGTKHALARKRPRARFTLARVLWDAGKQRRRALSLARRALRVFRHWGSLGVRRARTVAAWLEAHGESVP